MEIAVQTRIVTKILPFLILAFPTLVYLALLLHQLIQPVMFVFLTLNTDRNIHYHTVSFAFKAYKMSLILVFIAEKSCEDNGRAAVEDVKRKKKRRKTKK